MSADWLDDLCAEYEDTWRRTEDGVESRIGTFLTTRSLAPKGLAEATRALAEVDIERDWQWWRKWLRTEADRRPASELVAEFSRNTRVTKCVEVSRRLGVAIDDRQGLLEVEWRARAAWGDSPHPDEYPLVQTPTDKWTAPRHHVTIRDENAGTTRRFPLHGLTEFGRQRSTEVFTDGVHSTGLIHRVQIASRDDPRFSRQQFRVQVLSPEFALVTNWSQTHPVQWSDSHTLAHEQGMVVRFPFRLACAQLAFECG